MLYPLLWLLVSSFRPTEEIFPTPGLLPTRGASSSNYTQGWTALGAAVQLLLRQLGDRRARRDRRQPAVLLLAAYAFARLEFRGCEAAGSRSCW